MNATGSVNLIDAHIGARIELRRTALGLTRAALAQALNNTVEQVEAFERGAVRVSAATLFEIADLFDVKVAHFFEVDGFGPGQISVPDGFSELDQAR